MMNEILTQADEKMEKAVEVLKEDFGTVRTGRANPALFSKIVVDYYGTPTPLQQLASFHTPEPRVLTISPFDKSALANIEKALQGSNMGANPANDGNMIRMVMPELTEQRRKEYVKLVKSKAENAKISVRNIRRKAKEDIDHLIKEGEAGEDEGNRAEKELDTLTKKYTDRVEEITKNKEVELLDV